MKGTKSNALVAAAALACVALVFDFTQCGRNFDQFDVEHFDRPSGVIEAMCGVSKPHNYSYDGGIRFVAGRTSSDEISFGRSSTRKNHPKANADLSLPSLQSDDHFFRRVVRAAGATSTHNRKKEFDLRGGHGTDVLEVKRQRNAEVPRSVSVEESHAVVVVSGMHIFDGAKQLDFKIQPSSLRAANDIVSFARSVHGPSGIFRHNLRLAQSEPDSRDRNPAQNGSRNSGIPHDSGEARHRFLRFEVLLGLLVFCGSFYLIFYTVIRPAQDAKKPLEAMERKGIFAQMMPGRSAQREKGAWRPD